MDQQNICLHCCYTCSAMCSLNWNQSYSGRRLGSRFEPHQICIQIFPVILLGFAPVRFHKESDIFLWVAASRGEGVVCAVHLMLITFAPSVELLPELLMCTKGRQQIRLDLASVLWCGQKYAKNDHANDRSDVQRHFLRENQVWNRLWRILWHPASRI